MPEATYTLNVNGKSQTVTTDGNLPLLWALRDVVGLTGTKYGCAITQCRACTVLVDGSDTRSCTTSAKSASGKAITTIEGVPDRVVAALQEAWLVEQVPQCGYCQSGMILAAASLLAKKPRPTDSDINTAVANICACGTYVRVRKGIHRAAAALA